MDLSIIIPTRNEIKRLPRTLNAYIRALDKKGIDYEIIIADNSTDDTPKFVKNLNNKRVRLVRVKERGKGIGVLKGFLKAKGKIIGFVDADNSITPSQFLKLVRLTNKYDCVIGSRGLFREHAVEYHNSFLRKFFSFLLTTIFVKGLFGLRINDSQCGAKVFRRDKLLRIIPLMKLNNAYFDIELLWRFSKIGSIKEVPIKWRDVVGTHFKWSELITGSLSLIKLRIGL